MGDEGGGRLYTLSAYFGPYAQQERATDGYPSNDGPDPATHPAGRFPDDPNGNPTGQWASAKCPADGVSAHFFVTPEQPDAKVPRLGDAGEGDEVRHSAPFMRAALKAFAERTARRHGCMDVETP